MPSRTDLIGVGGASFHAGTLVVIAEREVGADVAFAGRGPIATAQARGVAARVVRQATAGAALHRTI